MTASKSLRLLALAVLLAALSASRLLSLAPAHGADDALIAAEKRAKAAEDRANAAEKRARATERELNALRAEKGRRGESPSEAAERAADRETARKLDEIITQQLLRDAGRR
jgi:hypothetical protein